MRTNPIARAYRFLIRMDVAAWLLLIALLLAAIGSCFPQRPSESAADPAVWEDWEASLRSRYSRLTPLLIAVGAFRFHGSPFFITALILLTLATLLCTLDRWAAIWRRTFRPEVRCTEATFRLAPQGARLIAPPGLDLIALLREGFAASGFRIRAAAASEKASGNPAAEGAAEGPIYLRADRNRLSPIATLISHLGVVLLFLAALLSSGFAWREQLTLGPGAPAQLEHRPDLTIEYKSFRIDRYSDGSASQYDAEVVLLNGGQPVASASMRVNQPLTYQGIGLYLQGFSLQDDGYSLTLLAAYDPGYAPVLAAGFLTLLGLTVSFNLPHCCIHARIDPEGAVWLAGRADRRACDFERQFADIVAHLKRELTRGGVAEGETPC